MIIFQIEIDDLEAETVRELLNIKPDFIDIRLRKDDQQFWFHGDFIKRMEEIKPESDG